MLQTINPTAVGPIATDVSGTLVDVGGVVWAGATVVAIFFAAPNIPGPYFSNGEYDFPRTWTGTTDANGYFNVQLADNSAIAPAGSMWQFVIAPNATQPAVVMRFQVVGTAMDISSVFTAQSYQLQGTRIMSLPLPRAQGSSAIAVPPNDGGMFFDTQNGTPSFWAQHAWRSFMVQLPMKDGEDLNTQVPPYAPPGIGYAHNGVVNGPPFASGTSQWTTVVSLGTFQLCVGEIDPGLWMRRWQSGAGWSAWSQITTTP